MFFRKTGHFAIGVQIRMLRRKIRLFYVTGLYFAIIMNYITRGPPGWDTDPAAAE